MTCCFLGNPLEEKHSGEGDWRDQATRRLPRLKKLDGKNTITALIFISVSLLILILMDHNHGPHLHFHSVFTVTAEILERSLANFYCQ